MVSIFLLIYLIAHIFNQRIFQNPKHDFNLIENTYYKEYRHIIILGSYSAKLSIICFSFCAER